MSAAQMRAADPKHILFGFHPGKHFMPLLDWRFNVGLYSNRLREGSGLQFVSGRPAANG